MIARANASGSRCGHVAEADGGDRERGQPVGDRADDRDAVLLQVERGDRGDPQHDGDEHGRHLGRVGPQGEDDRERRDADGQRRQADLAELRHHAPRACRRRPVPPPSTPSSLEIWLDGDDQGEAADEAGQHRPGEEVGDEPGARQAGGQAHAADEQREQRRERDEAAAVAEGERGDGGGRVGRDRRARPDRQLPAGAEHGVGEQRRQRGEEPGLGRHAGQRGVRHALRHEHRPHRDRREEVWPQPAAPVAAAASRGWAASEAPAGTSARSVSPCPRPPRRSPPVPERPRRHSTPPRASHFRPPVTPAPCSRDGIAGSTPRPASPA